MGQIMPREVNLPVVYTLAFAGVPSIDPINMRNPCWKPYLRNMKFWSLEVTLTIVKHSLNSEGDCLVGGCRNNFHKRGFLLFQQIEIQGLNQAEDNRCQSWHTKSIHYWQLELVLAEPLLSRAITPSPDLVIFKMKLHQVLNLQGTSLMLASLIVAVISLELTCVDCCCSRSEHSKWKWTGACPGEAFQLVFLFFPVPCFCRQFIQGNTDSAHLPFGVLKVLCICNSCSFKN